MNILFASSSSGSRGGGELFLPLLAGELATRGHGVALWASTHVRMDELCATFAEFGTVHRSGYRNMYDHPARCFSVFFHGKAIRRIAKEWRTLAPDVLHLNKQNLEDAFDLQRAAKESGLPCVATVHITQSANYLGARLAFLRDALSRRELRRFPGPFAVIQCNRKRELEAFLDGAGRVAAIENGVVAVGGLKRDIGRGERGPEDLIFVCTARMEEQKRPLLFVEWAVRLHRDFPGAQFVWVGDGRLASAWDAAVERAGAADYVKRVGWQRDVSPWLLAADVYLHTARYESFLPLSVLEAMSVGLPVVMPPDLMADIPFLQEQDPFVLPLDALLAAALKDADLRGRRGQAGKVLWKTFFSVGRMADDYETFYRSVL